MFDPIWMVLIVLGVLTWLEVCPPRDATAPPPDHPAPEGPPLLAVRLLLAVLPALVALHDSGGAAPPPEIHLSVTVDGSHRAQTPEPALRIAPD